jgi:hypothetical protein
MLHDTEGSRMNGYDATTSRNTCGHSGRWYAGTEGTLHVVVYVEEILLPVPMSFIQSVGCGSMILFP